MVTTFTLDDAATDSVDRSRLLLKLTDRCQTIIRAIALLEVAAEVAAQGGEVFVRHANGTESKVTWKS